MSVFGAGTYRGGMPASQDPRLYTPDTSFRHVTNRTAVATTVTNGIASSMSRCWQMSPVPIRFIQVAFWNGYVNQTTGLEGGPGAASNISWSVEYNGGYKQLPYSGAAQGSIADNAIGLTDIVDLGLTIPAYTPFFLKNWLANSTAMITHNWGLAADKGRGDSYIFNGTDQTMTAMSAGEASGVYVTYPSVVLSYSNRKVWAAMGDSTCQGVEDRTPDPSGGRGWFGRALAKAGIPHLNMGCGGDRMTWFNASNAKRLALAQLAGVRAGTNGYGINDYENSRTAANVIADRETLRGFFPGMPIFDSTTPPKTTSTDSWKTAANQTIANTTKNTARIAGNNSLRAGVLTSPGFLDIAAYTETSTAFELLPTKDGGVWLPGKTGEGIHANSYGYSSVSAEFEKLLAVTAAP